MQRMIRHSACACGTVRCEGEGAPIVSGVCYCRSCQKGGAVMESLPGAARVRDADGGTPVLSYRDDRFRCVAGADELVAYKLGDRAPTRRMVASCCNTGMFMKYEPGFWISSYRRRHVGDLPPIEMRFQTRNRESDTSIPTDAPKFPGFPLRLALRVVRARLEMLVGL